MKKVLIATITLAMALCLFGCSQGAESSQGQQEDSRTAEVGEPVVVSGNWGDIEVTIESFEDSLSQTAALLEYGHIDEDQHVGLLKMVVNNISCDNGTDAHDYINLPSSFYVTAPDGVSLTDMSVAYEVSGYTPVAGETFECAIGESKRLAVFYFIEPDMDEVTVHAGDTIITVPVEVI